MKTNQNGIFGINWFGIAVLLMTAVALTGCGAIQSVGEYAYDKAEEAGQTVDAGVDRSDELAATAAENKLDRAEKRTDWVFNYGQKVDDLLIRGNNQRDRRFVSWGAYQCSRSPIGEVRYPLPIEYGGADGGVMRVVCEFPPDLPEN